MRRRDFFKITGLSVPALGLSGAECSGNGQSLPNIVFVMADDMGYGDVGCYNPDSKIPTPNIDRLAEAGIRFTDAHSPSAVCTPTRYGVLTGRYCWRTSLTREVFYNYEHPLIEPGRMTVASLLKQRGYATACIGKWHLGLGWFAKPGEIIDFNRPLPWPSQVDTTLEDKLDFTQPVFGGPVDIGFDYAFYTAGCATAQPPYAFMENRSFVEIPATRYKPRGSGRAGMVAPGWNQEDADPTFIRRAIHWLERHNQESPAQPFFLYLPLSAPHHPPVPPPFIRGQSHTDALGDMNVLADWCLGQITETLDRLGLTGKTLVIFTSDNGPLPAGKEQGHRSAGPLRGLKAHIWEGGHRIPFIARWPGHIEPGTTSDEPICLTDLLATSAALANVPLPNTAGEDSYNILPALLGHTRNRPIREAIVAHSVYGVFSIRQGDWKLIIGTKTSGGWPEPRGEGPTPGMPGQLYNLARDPYETNDQWEQHPVIVERLTNLLEGYKTTGRSTPLR